jgi:hypothetical protein
MNRLDYLMGQNDLLTEMVDWYNNTIEVAPEVKKTLEEELEELLSSLKLRLFLNEKEIEEIRSTAECIDDRSTFE